MYFTYRGIDHTLLAPSGGDAEDWRQAHGTQFSALLEEELARFRPEILFTYGGHPEDVFRQRRARAMGCRVVFALFNVNYQRREFFDHIDFVLTPSEFLSEHYRHRLGIHTTPLPTPLNLDDVLAPERVPLRLTMVNPSIGKGAMLVAGLADELGNRFPEIPIEVVESRGSGRLLVQAGFVAGFDLRRHANLILRPATRLPREIYLSTRVLLVPSVIEEASARVVAEALVNGIPIVASDRGGLPENCAGAGFILPLPDGLDMATRRPVDASLLQPWIDRIVYLFRDANAYARTSDLARAAGARYLPNAVAPLYLNFFRRVLNRDSVVCSWC
jgi:glycosyltransferase involved in cell wall biosynthesis